MLRINQITLIKTNLKGRSQLKKLSKKFKVTASVLLIITLIGSIGVPALAESKVISEGLNKIENALHANPHAVEAVKRQEEIPPTLTQDITTPIEIENPIDAIKARVAENRKHRLHQQDEFNYVQKDVEELLLSGATLEDIYRSDEIGNQWLVNPRDLIKTKHEEKQTWDDIERDVIASKEKHLKELIEKRVDLVNKFSGQVMSDAEKLDILQHIDSNDDQVDDVIAAFKAEGRQGLLKLHEKNVQSKGEK